jgi:hypothetical protein
MTNVTIELPHWDEVQKRDRLTGVSLTGYVEAMDAVGVDSTNELSRVPVLWGGYDSDITLYEFLSELNSGANTTAQEYAAEMRIPSPLLVTAV